MRRADKDVKYSFVSVNKFIDAYKQSPAYQRQQLALSAPPELNPEAPDPLVRLRPHSLIVTPFLIEKQLGPAWAG